MVEAHVERKDPRYVKMQLSRRIKVRFIEEIVDANVIKGVLYLEKLRIATRLRRATGKTIACMARRVSLSRTNEVHRGTPRTQDLNLIL